METLWFCLVAFLLTTYVLLDGFDLGAGILHLFIARTPAERATLIRTIGPVWDGNEVWLIATAGTLLCVFPSLFAAAFSGFYLPLMIVLWLIAGRALGIEFRHQFESPLWVAAWDVVFALSSGALALVFGIALGNVARGVPLGDGGHFFAPLWTDFSPRGATGILDAYTILAGFTAVAALAHHGALWVAYKTEGDLRSRARRAAGIAGSAALGLTLVATLWTRSVQPHMALRFSEHPGGYLFPAIAAAGLAASFRFRMKDRDRDAFLGSCVYLAGLLAAIAFSLYPFLLPGSTDPAWGLTAQGTAASDSEMKTTLAWWIPGMILASGYSGFVYWKFRGKTGGEEE